MNGNVDPRIDKMVAYLYGELPEAEERAFRRLLEKDDALRAEYEELSGTRETLRGWEVEERAPSFVLVAGGEESAASSRTSRRRRVAGGAASGPGWLDRLLEPLRGFAITPVWGLAATAALLLVLAIGGFRVERVDGGLAFRFGEPQPAGEFTDPSGARLATTTPRPTGRTLPDLGGGNLPAGAELPPGVVLPVGAYLTRDDLQMYDEDLMLTLAQLLNDYSRKRDRDMAEGFQSLYQQVSSQSTYNFEELSGRIDVLGHELLLESDRSARGFREVLRTQPTTNDTLETEEN